MSKSLEKIDRINIVLGVINIIILFITIYVLIRDTNKSEEIAEKSGAFEKANFSYSFCGYHIDPNLEYDLILLIPELIDSFYFELPIGFHNHSNISLSNIIVNYKYPLQENLIINSDEIDYISREQFDVNRRYTTNLNSQSNTYSIKQVNPENSFEYGDIIGLNDFNNSQHFQIDLEVSYSADNVLGNKVHFTLSLNKYKEVLMLIDSIARDKIENRKQDTTRDFIVAYLEPTLNIEDNTFNNYLYRNDTRNVQWIKIWEDWGGWTLMNRDGSEFVSKNYKSR